MLCINGDANHLHMLISLHQSVPLATLVRDMKRGSSIWIKNSGLFPEFSYWGDEYFAFTLSPRHIEDLKYYIMHQHAHHHSQKFEDEVARLIANAGGTFDDKMLS